MAFDVKLARGGQIIADRYQLEAPLGRGGMGRIWRAEHLRLRSKVALKFLDPAIADDPEMFERFLREARCAAAVRSAHVVQTFDCGVEGGSPYISMELLDGESLDARLMARTRLTPAELGKIFGEVARAVGNAHALGIIHRDLKPGNIFISREGELEITKVLDFGIAKLMTPHLDLDSAAGTRTGTVLGTPHYMSPEQVRGCRSLDHRTDLWSLAVIAFECLTGDVPFPGGGSGDVIVQICTAKPRRPSEVWEVPVGFDEWFLKGTDKEPSSRFASAREMAESLSAILARSLTPAASARSLRDDLGKEPATLCSGSERSEPTLSATAAGTHALTTLRRSASASLPPVWLPRGRRRWLSIALPPSLLCGAALLALWPAAHDTAPSIVDRVELAAVGSPGGAALDSTAQHRAAAGTGGGPELALDAPMSATLLVDAPSAERAAPRPAAPGARASAAKKQRKPERPARPAAAVAPSTTEPTSSPPPPTQTDPFSERR